MSYKGSIYESLLDAFMKKDGLTVGEKFLSIFKEIKKDGSIAEKLLKCEDKDIYDAILKYLSFPFEEDELLTEEEFEEWMSQK